MLREIKRMGAQLYLGTQRREFVQAYAEAVVEARLLYRQAEPHLSIAKADGTLPAIATDASLAAVNRFLNSAAQVARVADTAATPPTWHWAPCRPRNFWNRLVQPSSQTRTCCKPALTY